jgi:hypothetical protein
MLQAYLLIIAIAVMECAIPKRFCRYFEWQLINIGACSIALIYVPLDSNWYRLCYYATLLPICYQIGKLARDDSRQDC